MTTGRECSILTASPLRERLAHYVQRFQTVEVNSTFYRWPSDAVFGSWYRRVPDDFLTTVKAPRGLTHGARLYGPERWLERVARGMRVLGHKRGVLLVQTPPDLAYDYPRLAYFLRQLPAWLGSPSSFAIRAGIVRRCLGCWSSTLPPTA